MYWVSSTPGVEAKPGMSWMAELPFPITAMRLFSKVKLKSAWFWVITRLQWRLWKAIPLNLSNPGIWGMRGVDRGPLAEIKMSVVWV